MMKNVTRVLAYLCLCVWLSGCSYFSPDNDDGPADLVKFDKEVDLQKVWSVNVGKGQGKRYTRLNPVVSNGVIYIASNNGLVLAIDDESGDDIWRTKLDFDISGGVGVGAGMVLLGTENSQVIAIDQKNGEVLWETQVSSEVLAAPATDGDVVVAQSIDGKLTGLDAESGEQVWVYETTVPVPALSLRGTSSPLVVQNYVIAGFGNGLLVSVAMDNGTQRWEERIAIPTGRSEIDRLVDIDGALYLNDKRQLIVPSFQGYLAVVDVVSGQTTWRIKESSTVGTGSGFGNIYISDENGHVLAYKTGQDDRVWSNEQLSARQLSAPTGFNNYVAIADYEGYIHLLSQIDGHMMGRVKVDRKGVRVGMLSQNNTLYVYGNSGNLVALKVRQ